MSIGYNNITLVGRITQELELRQVKVGEDNRNVIKFGLAVGRNFLSANNERETDFFNITAWDGLAENLAKYQNKGSKVLVTGRVFVGSYEKDGINIRTFDITATDILFLDNKKEEVKEEVPIPETPPPTYKR